MEIFQYPTELNCVGTSVLKRLFDTLRRRRRESIMLQLKAFLKVLQQTDLGSLGVHYMTKKLKSLGGGISEIRIPSDHCSDGVTRIYFITHPTRRNAILILHAEFKRNDKIPPEFERAARIKREAVREYEKRRESRT